MAGVAFGGVNGGSSCATLNSAGPRIDCQSDSLSRLLGGLGVFVFHFSSPICFWSGSWMWPVLVQGLTLS